MCVCVFVDFVWLMLTAWVCISESVSGYVSAGVHERSRCLCQIHTQCEGIVCLVLQNGFAFLKGVCGCLSEESLRDCVSIKDYVGVNGTQDVRLYLSMYECDELISILPFSPVTHSSPSTALI